MTKTDTVEAVIKKTTQHVEIVDDYTVVFHLQQVVPEFVENISSIQDLPMESKARWDAGGKDLYGQKVEQRFDPSRQAALHAWHRASYHLARCEC
ncbi:MAG TPA: hypothetical protein VI542_30400 [Candidatus Tectomicrobia bacterium]